LIEEPQPLLRERQRDRGVARAPWDVAGLGRARELAAPPFFEQRWFNNVSILDMLCS
jgi:hypothetical protein